MYVTPNYKTKKEFKEAVKNNLHIEFYQPGLGPDAPDTGTIYVEGPHYPKPHTWYAQVFLVGGKVVKVK